jgi:hypothetical protein
MSKFLTARPFFKLTVLTSSFYRLGLQDFSVPADVGDPGMTKEDVAESWETSRHFSPFTSRSQQLEVTCSFAAMLSILQRNTSLCSTTASQFHRF